MFKRFLLTAGSILVMTAATASTAMAADPENTVLIDLSTGGPVKMELRPDIAPQSSTRIKELTREGFYNGVVFHRVIDGFMAQTGDPTGTGTGGSSKPDLPAEFSSTNYDRGTVGMARTSDPNSGNSQFFICYQDCSFLNNQYTVVGQVTEGMEFVDKLAKGEPPANPDKIVKMQIAADAGKTAPATTAGTAPAPSPKDNGMPVGGIAPTGNAPSGKDSAATPSTAPEAPAPVTTTPAAH